MKIVVIDNGGCILSNVRKYTGSLLWFIYITGDGIGL